MPCLLDSTFSFLSPPLPLFLLLLKYIVLFFVPFFFFPFAQCCISLAIGNKEEHAILLCNFFLYFGKKALVTLGTSVLEVSAGKV